MYVKCDWLDLILTYISKLVGLFQLTIQCPVRGLLSTHTHTKQFVPATLQLWILHRWLIELKVQYDLDIDSGPVFGGVPWSDFSLLMYMAACRLCGSDCGSKMGGHLKCNRLMTSWSHCFLLYVTQNLRCESLGFYYSYNRHTDRLFSLWEWR